MNHVVLTGRLTKDVEVKATNSGKSVTMFVIAVDDGFGDTKRTYFPQIVVWGKTAEACGRCLHKGSKVAVSGKLTTRTYDNNQGQKIYVTEVVADMYNGVEFLDSKKDSQEEQVEGYNGLDDSEVPF